MIGTILVGAAAIGVILLVLIFRYGIYSNKKNKRTYVKKNTLFTPAERSFLGMLNLAFGNKAYVLGKVRVADVIIPNKA